MRENTRRKVGKTMESKYMYYIVENHVNVETGAYRGDILHLDEYLPSLFESYEKARAYIEKRLVPHSTELRKQSGFFAGSERKYVDGKETWWVLSNRYYHTVYRIRKAKVASE